MPRRNTNRLSTAVAMLLLTAVPGWTQGDLSGDSPLAGDSALVELLLTQDWTRAEMAERLLRAFEVAAFQPEDCISGEEMFSDVPASSPFCSWVEELVRRGLTAGCAEDRYCPGDSVNRQQMAVFLVRAIEAAVEEGLAGPAGGDLMGDYPSPSIAGGAVTTPKLANSAVTTAKLADGTVTTAKLAGELVNRITELESLVAEQQALLAGMSRLVVDGHDTLRFSGMNLQVLNGTGTTDGAPNGLGNLLVGYSAEREIGDPAERTGSHYLVVGDQHEWTRFGGILAGFTNTATGDWASVTGGRFNSATGEASSVTGGQVNLASGVISSVSAGSFNQASGHSAAVSGGNGNTASGTESSILGGAGVTVADTHACHPSCE